MKMYFTKIYESRYFWQHLARIELKNKFRRSKLGILWTFVSPLCLTLIMSFIFGVAFKQDIVTYAPYILSGIIFWDVVSSSFVGGGSAIIGNAAYIQQFNHPITIYTLKSTVVYIVNFLISMIALAIWILIIAPKNLIVGLISLPLTIVIYFIFSWGGTTIAAYINTKYRDYPQMMALLLQTLWYISPVFMQESLFSSHTILTTWFNINPITHMLLLVRAPFLYGTFPSLLNYGVSFLFSLVILLSATLINHKMEKDIIFYI